MKGSGCGSGWDGASSGRTGLCVDATRGAQGGVGCHGRDTYTCLKVTDEHFELTTIKPKIDAVETVADTTEWLSMRYKSNKQDVFDLQFDDEEEVAD